jgi:glycerol kinase
MKKYILTIDQGTTSTRVILFDHATNQIAVSQMEFPQLCPESGWVLHNPETIWYQTKELIGNVLRQAAISPKDIGAIGITNQRETTVLWNKETGKPVYPAIVWQSRQSDKICERLSKLPFAKEVAKKTGLRINPYFSATKLRWIFENVKGTYEDALQNKLLFGTMDTYLLWKLSNGKVHSTDVTNASRTLLYNIHDLAWDDELLDFFSIPKSILPEVKPSSGVFGYAVALEEDYPGFKDVPIASMIGDQQAALFGQCCTEEGAGKTTYGTGCFLLMNTGKNIIESQKGLLSTVAWSIHGEVSYALEGSVFVGGSAVQWLRDGMKFFSQSSDCENFIENETTSQNIMVVPAFVGLGAPYWDDLARGAIFGLTRSTSRQEIIAATVESIAYQVMDVTLAMQEEIHKQIAFLGVDGGASKNNYLMQFQADLLNTKLIRTKCLETTSLGAMYLAGLAIGFYQNIDEIKQLHQIENVFVSNMDEEIRKKKISLWHKAVKACQNFE